MWRNLAAVGTIYPEVYLVKGAPLSPNQPDYLLWEQPEISRLAELSERHSNLTFQSGPERNLQLISMCVSVSWMLSNLTISTVFYLNTCTCGNFNLSNILHSLISKKWIFTNSRHLSTFSIFYYFIILYSVHIDMEVFAYDTNVLIFPVLSPGVFNKPEQNLLKPCYWSPNSDVLLFCVCVSLTSP